MSTASSIVSSSEISNLKSEFPTPAPAASQSQISDRRLAANRANAQKSTGPKTDEGKQISSQNSTTHTLHSATLHLPRMHALEPDLRADLNPQGPLQEFLFQRLLSLAARLDTLHDAEEALFSRLELARKESHDQLKSCNSNRWFESHPHLPGPAETLADYLTHDADPVLRLHHLEMRLHRTFHAALRQLRDLQKNKTAQNEPTGIPAEKSQPACDQ